MTNTLDASEWDRVAQARIVSVICDGHLGMSADGRARAITQALADLGPRPDTRPGLTAVTPEQAGELWPYFHLTNENGEMITARWRSQLYRGQSVIRLPVPAPFFARWGEASRDTIDYRCNVFMLHVDLPLS